jgi:hypothetical protein
MRSNINHIFNWYTYCHGSAHRILHTVMKCCTEKKISFVSKKQQHSKWQTMWNNAEKFKLKKLNTNQNKTCLLLPLIEVFSNLQITHYCPSHRTTHRERHKGASNKPQSSPQWCYQSATALCSTSPGWACEEQPPMHCLLGDHPFPHLHVGRYLDGLGMRVRLGKGAEKAL